MEYAFFGKTTSKGFTLVELLISIAIVAILTASVIPSFGSFSRKQTLVQAAENFGSDISLVHNKASSGVAVSGIDVDWGIRLSPSCSTGVTSYDIGYFDQGGFNVIETISLQDGISIKCTDGSSIKEIKFLRISGILESGSESLEVVSSHASPPRTVIIGERGQVNIE